jgi:hypothetical protein
MSLFSPRFRRKVLVVGMNLAVQMAAAEAGLLLRGTAAPPAPAALHGEAPKPAPERPSLESPSGEQAPGRPRRRGRVRRELRSAGMAVGLARLQLRAGLTGDAEATLDRLHQEIQSLRQRLDRRGERAAARPG